MADTMNKNEFTREDLVGIGLVISSFLSFIKEKIKAMPNLSPENELTDEDKKMALQLINLMNEGKQYVNLLNKITRNIAEIDRVDITELDKKLAEMDQPIADEPQHSKYFQFDIGDPNLTLKL